MQYDLIFEGGGVRGLVFAGAMAEFEASGHTFDRLLGTSAGGITAVLFAAGYRSHETFDLLYDAQAGRPTFANFLAHPVAVDLPVLRQGALRELLRATDAAALPDWLEGPVDDLVLRSLMAVRALHPLLSFLEHGYWCSDRPFLD
jgi:predicted acylesterase/phospholipase RssA